MLFETFIIFSATTLSVILNSVMFNCVYEEEDNIENTEISLLIDDYNLKKTQRIFYNDDYKYYTPFYYEQTIEIDNEQMIELDNQQTIELDNEQMIELDNEKPIELDNQQTIELDNQQTIELDNEQMIELDNQQTIEDKINDNKKNNDNSIKILENYFILV